MSVPFYVNPNFSTILQPSHLIVDESSFQYFTGNNLEKNWSTDITEDEKWQLLVETMCLYLYILLVNNTVKHITRNSWVYGRK